MLYPTLKSFVDKEGYTCKITINPIGVFMKSVCHTMIAFRISLIAVDYIQ